MKKWFALLLVIAVVAFGWWWARTYARFEPDWMKPKFAKVDRGDIVVPITASGLIVPEQEIEVKSEASGEVTKIHVEEGDFVRAGDLLVELDPDDEQRNVDRADAALKRARAALQQSEIAVKKAGISTISAKARVKELEANLRIAKADVDRIQANPRQFSVVETVTVDARYDLAEAQLESGRANVDLAEEQELEAAETVKIQEAAVEDATKSLEDARERLAETKIRSSHDALVTDVRVEPGMLVQSGTQSLTGGTAIAMLANVSSLKVVARVNEADYGRVRDISPETALPRMTADDLSHEAELVADEEAAMLQSQVGAVTLTVDAFPDEKYQGMIRRVEPQGKLNPGAAVIQFDVHVLITDERWRELPLGTQAQVEFKVESVEDALRVPAEAVKMFEGQRGIYLRTEPVQGSNETYGKRFVPCRFGITDSEYTQLVEAIGSDELPAPGDEVYTKLPSSPDDD